MKLFDLSKANNRIEFRRCKINFDNIKITNVKISGATENRNDKPITNKKKL